MSNPGWLGRQMCRAAYEVRKLKRHSPHIFPAWQELVTATIALQNAKDRHLAAKEAWRKVGNLGG